ncbi:phage scaffolding protein, partial [Paenibacillus larvae]|uniref:phage scaffolding protein n=1 Tax=Paenibacillus larvae TaxID=1464 RepID=UPI00227DAD42
MEWLKKLLKGKGLTGEQIASIVGGVEENYKGYIPKHRFDEVNEAKKQLEVDIKDRDKQLSELKKNVGDNEELKKQIEQLQGENQT